jgi:hypothetical protein
VLQDFGKAEAEAPERLSDRNSETAAEQAAGFSQRQKVIPDFFLGNFWQKWRPVWARPVTVFGETFPWKG